MTHVASGLTLEKARVDSYPSRCGGKPALLARQDPVVYAGHRAQAPISRDQIEHYDKQGFVVVEGVFDNEAIGLLQDELERLRSCKVDTSDGHRIAEPGDNTLRSIFAIHKSNPLFSRLAHDTRLVDIGRFILDDEVYIHQSRLNYKPGFRGREFYWHSDFETWHVEDGMPSMRALSMSIALTDNSVSNGPLMLIPGSHRKYVVCGGKTPENHFLESLRKQEYGVPCDKLLKELADEGGVISIDAQPGSVILFDCNAMHGSNGNITPYPRSNAFLVYNAMSNRVGRPFSGQPSRPEHICTRDAIVAVEAMEGRLYGE